MTDRLDDYTDDPAFRQWLRSVNALVTAKVGIGIMDLADQPYRDWYDDATTPEDAAQTVLEEEGLIDEDESEDLDYD